jgi:hypothetical protein
MNFVKPGAAVVDPRDEETKTAELSERTSKNLMHVQKQLVAQGSSIEAVLAHVAKSALGLNIQPHVPVKLVKPAEAA